MAFADNKPRHILEGILPHKVTLGEDCVVGDVLVIDSGEWVLADESAATAFLIAGEDGKDGETITAFTAAIIGSFSGATAGNEVIVIAGAGYEENTVGQHVGLSINATDLYIGPQLLPVAIT